MNNKSDDLAYCPHKSIYHSLIENFCDACTIIKLEAKSKELVEALEYADKTLTWYKDVFKGSEHEFEHYWRVELPHVISEALAKHKGN